MHTEEYFREQLRVLFDQQDTIDQLRDIREKFNNELLNAKKPRHLNDQLNIENGNLQIEYLGRNFIATPRIIKNKDGLFAFEYRFVVEQDGASHDIWRFYLFQGGFITKGSDGTEATRISQLGDDKAYHRIVAELLSQIQASTLIQPAD